MCLDPRELNKYLKREQYKLPTWEEIASQLHGAKYFSILDANQGVLADTSRQQKFIIDNL